MSIKVNKNTIKCAVFDLDGTLLNTLKTINYYLNTTLERHSLSPIPEGKCREFVGDGAVKLISRTLDYLGVKDEGIFKSVFDDYNRAYDADPYYLTEHYEGVKELLLAMKKEGIVLAVLSNKPDFATRAAVNHFFPNTFDAAFGAREGIALKPDPRALLSMLESLSVTPEQVAYIGDSEPDVLTGQNSGVALPISVTWGFRTKSQLLSVGASIFAHSPDEILSIIKTDAK